VGSHKEKGSYDEQRGNGNSQRSVEYSKSDEDRGGEGLMYYFFEPLMEEGKQVVRCIKPGEFWDNEIPIKCEGYSTYQKPILTMRKFEQDPFGKIRDVYYKRYNHAFRDSYYQEMWAAISETMKELEEEK
jgi:hypothetical protein